ncbi:unnamed protein product [Thlaspi arvense]|uniref:Oxysterol-binding protein n=1 Tax=Thlaspi arvense TaxID=13288 RepID=A0AAU9T0X9_THLAR|nr:unnamed protein product [Thlaspi arvense]
MEEEEEARKHPVVAKPFSLEDEKKSEHSALNVILQILSLLKNVRPGTDLTDYSQLPPQLNQPRSQLQLYGETIYSFAGQDLMGECSRRDLPIERLKAVVTWNILKLRPVIFGLVPYNPILGETHHVSNGHINVLCEQVSHHPPVSALHATHEKENIDLMWVQYITPKFRGAYLECDIKGKRVLKLLNRKETYEMGHLKLITRLLPVPVAYWAGKTKIKCPETDLEAELHSISDSLIGRFKGSSNRSVKGKISESSSGDKLYDIFGHWDRTVLAKNVKTGELEVIYNAEENILGLKAPTVKNLKEVTETESTMVWSDLTEAILKKDWERAREAKRTVEEKQRESLKQREASGESWVSKHFSVVKNGKDWDCSPLQPTVPRAPLAEEKGITRHPVLTKPFSLEDEKDSEHTASNVIRRILSLLKSVRPGSDLTNFQLPPQLNLPKSRLQCYGEMIYSFSGQDLLGECSRRELPIERLKSVVAWNISKIRPVLFGQAPYNPVLGETHHVSNGHINVLIEQVSHHPAVSALQATHEKENIDVTWVQYFIPKFRGAYVELESKGKRVMKLRSRKETYDMCQPRLIVRLLPTTRADWAGDIKIKCPETDLEAELHLISDSFIERLRGNNNRSIKGNISVSSSGNKLYDIFGHWDRIVTTKDIKTGELEDIYNAKENISGLKAPTVKNPEEVMESESAMVWSEVSEGILKKDWERASEAKKAVEEKQREALKQRKASGESWVPKHFSVVKNGKDWDCSPLHPTVPRAPLVITEAQGES